MVTYHSNLRKEVIKNANSQTPEIDLSDFEEILGDGDVPF
nr:MAG TPA: hypothetical protein [Caudoviricetes sp.]